MFIELVQAMQMQTIYQQLQLFIIFLLREAPSTVIFVNYHRRRQEDGINISFTKLVAYIL